MSNVYCKRCECFIGVDPHDFWGYDTWWEEHKTKEECLVAMQERKEEIDKKIKEMRMTNG